MRSPPARWFLFAAACVLLVASGDGLDSSAWWYVGTFFSVMALQGMAWSWIRENDSSEKADA